MSAPQDFVRKQQTGDPFTKLVLKTIADYTNYESGICYPSIDTLAKDCECSRSTVSRRLQDLHDQGFIKLDIRSGRQSIITLVGYAEWFAALPVRTFRPNVAKTNETSDDGVMSVGHGLPKSTGHGSSKESCPRDIGVMSAGHEGHVHGTHEIYNINILPNTTTLVKEKPKEDSKYNLSELENTLTEAAGACLANPVNCSGLLNLAVPLMWLEQGCDLEKDILPTLRAFARRDAGRNITTWNYFSKAVAQTKKQRDAGLPEVSLQSRKQDYSEKPRKLTVREIYERQKQREKEQQKQNQEAKVQEVSQ